MLRPRPFDLFVDPAAGDGAIIHSWKAGGPWARASWVAIEIDESRATALHAIDGTRTIIGNATERDWPPGHVVANPPFRSLDEFWLATADHRARHGVWCAVFGPVPWWSAEKRRDYTRPDHIIQLGWRPVFRPQAGPAHKGAQDFAWWILYPEASSTTTWERVERPQTTSDG